MNCSHYKTSIRIPKLALVLLLFVCFAQMISAQNNQSYLLKINANILRVDDFENIYLLDDTNTISKYDNNLNLLYQYSFNRLGDISDIDVTNPQKIMLFFSDYQIILFLDNTLSEIDRLNLEDLSYWNITCLGLAPDNFIWMFDSANNKLIKIDAAGKELYSSNELYFDGISNDNQIRLQANQNYTLLYSSAKCIVFDKFGQYIKSLDLNNDKIILKDNSLLVLRNNSISIENLKPDFSDFQNILFEHHKTVKDFVLFKNKRLYYLDEIGLKKKILN